MSGRTTKFAAILAVLGASAAAAGCGGDGESNATREDPSNSGTEVGPLHVSAAGSGPYRTPGGDNSIQNFGKEASKSELVQAATGLHAYLVARVEKEWSIACSHLSKEYVAQLGAVASRSKQVSGESCAAALGALVVPMPKSETFDATAVDADSLRTDGRQGFLIYRAGSEPRFISMSKEAGTWKLATLSPTPF